MNDVYETLVVYVGRLTCISTTGLCTFILSLRVAPMTLIEKVANKVSRGFSIHPVEFPFSVHIF